MTRRHILAAAISALLPAAPTLTQREKNLIALSEVNAAIDSMRTRLHAQTLTIRTH